MFSRLGVFGRLTLIILMLLTAFVALGVGIYFIDTGKKDPDSLFPIPEQVAAITELLDNTPSSHHERIVKAIKSPELSFQLITTLPKEFFEIRRMQGIEWLTSQYFETSQEREIKVIQELPPGRDRFSRHINWLLSRYNRSILVAIELKTKKYVLFRIKAVTVHRLFGIPIGFFFGVYGFLFAALALWAIAREAKPLQQLAKSVELFGADGTPRHVESRGATEIQKLVRTVNHMQHRIAALIKGRTILLGAVSHDLKTYITRLRLRAEQVSNETLREKTISDLEQMTLIIDDAILIAKGEVNGKDTRTSVDIHEVLRNDIASRSNPEQIKLTGECNALISGNAIALSRMFANLIDNALRYGNTCEINISQNENTIIITFDDDGPGIPPEDRITIFEPFYRLEKSRNLNTGGSGLGLAIVKQIANAHNARIEVQENLQGGARFIVFFE